MGSHSLQRRNRRVAACCRRNFAAPKASNCTVTCRGKHLECALKTTLTVMTMALLAGCSTLGRYDYGGPTLTDSAAPLSLTGGNYSFYLTSSSRFLYCPTHGQPWHSASALGSDGAFYYSPHYRGLHGSHPSYSASYRHGISLHSFRYQAHGIPRSRLHGGLHRMSHRRRH